MVYFGCSLRLELTCMIPLQILMTDMSIFGKSIGKMEVDIVYNEDCLSGMQRLPDKSIDMICCDLPYGNSDAEWDTIIPFQPLWEQYKRLIKDDGAIVLFACGIFTHQLVMSNAKMFRYSLAWKRGNRIVGHLDANRRPLRCHEDILVFSKRGYTKYNPQKEYGLRYPTSIIDIGMSADEFSNRIHPAQKPVELMEYLVRTYSNKGDVVLDNCMGSGTTAIACIRSERHYVGFEPDKGFYGKLFERIKNEPVKLSLIA